jgi:hypothetical protein
LDIPHYPSARADSRRGDRLNPFDAENFGNFTVFPGFNPDKLSCQVKILSGFAVIASS